MSRAPGRLALLLLLLAACTGPRSEIVPRAQALDLDAPWRMRVIAIHDGLHHSRDPHVSHLIEVEHLSGPQAGTRATYPFDEWQYGGEPPDEDEELTVAPAVWVRGREASQGTPTPFYPE